MDVLNVRYPTAALLAMFDTDEVAAAAGVLPDTVIRRWKRKLISAWEADRIAVALGVHPAAVWGVSWFAPPPEMSRCRDDHPDRPTTPDGRGRCRVCEAARKRQAA